MSIHLQTGSVDTLSGVRIGEVRKRLGGGELRHGRGTAFWRHGAGWNVAYDDERGLWFDHAAGGGGGVLALVETALQCDRRGALAWLEAEGFIEPRTPPTEAEKRILARKRGIAGDIARDTIAWFRARCSELEAEKASLFETVSFKAHRRAVRAARELTRLEFGSASIVTRAFFNHRMSHPNEAKNLIERGRWWDSEDRRIAAKCVSLLVWAGTLEDSNAK